MAVDARDLTTVSNVKATMPRAEGPDADTLLQRLVTAASILVINMTSRDLIQRSYSEPYDGNGVDSFMLTQYPVTAVTSITENGQPVPQRVKFHDGGWVLRQPPGALTDAPAVLTRDCRRWCRGIQNVVVNYTAGYPGPASPTPGIPPDLEQAVIETVILRFKERARIGDASRTVSVGGGAETITFTQKDLTPSAASVVARYGRTFFP